MKIHSDILTGADVLDAVPKGCYLPELSYAGSRSRQYAFKVRLSGSSRYAMANLSDKAATWDEWGIFIDALFKLDSDALIGHYSTRDNFIEQTTNEYNRIKLNRPDLAPTHQAPWLVKN